MRYNIHIKLNSVRKIHNVKYQSEYKRYSFLIIKKTQIIEINCFFNENCNY